MADDSTIFVTGKLAFEPELQYTGAGTPVCRIVIPTHRKWRGKDDQWNEVTTWHRISIFGANGDNCAKYLKKGSLVQVRGRLEPDPATGAPRVWTNKEGVASSSYDIVADQVVFLEHIKSKEEANQGDYVPGFDDGWD